MTDIEDRLQTVLTDCEETDWAIDGGDRGGGLDAMAVQLRGALTGVHTLRANLDALLAAAREAVVALAEHEQYDDDDGSREHDAAEACRVAIAQCEAVALLPSRQEGGTSHAR